MTFLEAHQKFRQIEDEHELFNLRIQGFPVWDYLRFPVWRQFLEATGTCSNPHHRVIPKGKLVRAKNWLNVLKQTAFKNPFFAGQCDYLFIGHPRRKLVSDGTYLDLYSDPIIENLGPDKCLLIEMPSHRVPAKTKRICYTDPFFFYRRLYGIKSPILPVNNGALQKLNDFKLAFEQTSGEKINLKAMLQKKYSDECIIGSLFTKLLEKLHPKAVFIVSSYNKEHFLAACRKAGIPTIELQHGVMTPYHPGYAYPQGTRKELFPDYLFSFGKYWENTVPLPIAAERIFTVGYPYFDQESGLLEKTNKANMLLFISQGGTIGRKLSQFATQLKHYLPPAWQLIYKLHPSEVLEWRNRYTELASSNITVVETDYPPLYQLMAEAKIQIGVSSTALFEGLGFNCRTYIANLPGYEYMQPLIDQNICTLINTPDEINFKNINSNYRLKKDYFFADNWQDNLDRAMAQIGLKHQ